MAFLDQGTMQENIAQPFLFLMHSAYATLSVPSREEDMFFRFRALKKILWFTAPSVCLKNARGKEEAIMHEPDTSYTYAIYGVIRFILVNELSLFKNQRAE